MADETDPIKSLATARQKLIEERRGLAVAIALGYRRRRNDDPHTNEVRGAFVDVQNLIEAMDRAIAHEKQITNGQDESFVVSTLESDPAAAVFPDRRQ